MKILIVDDEPTILITLSHVLNNKDTTVITSSGLQEAKSVLSTHKFDLVITDMRLSGSNAREGLELLSHIKETSSETEVIVMTGVGSDSIREDSYRRGAFHYVEKPFDISHIIFKVRQVAAGRRANMEQSG